MIGLNSSTGRALGGIDHLRQSIVDILRTPLGSRVMRREYGSRLFSLVDAPLGEGTKLAIMAATVEALETWEPRLAIDTVSVVSYGAGRISLDLYATYLPDGRAVALDGIDVA
jgi:phage baseplate assembly protein W